jgi:hypothetical protein
VRQARGGPFQLGADRRSLLAGEVTAGHSRATAQSAGLLLAPGSPGCSSESSVRRARPAQRQQASTPTLSSPKRSNC